MAISVQYKLHFQAGTYGWSETVYSKQPNDMDQALTIGDTLMGVRCEINGEGVTPLGFVVSNINVDGDSRQLFSEKWGSKDFIDKLADKPWTAALIRLRANEQTRRNYMVRGMPDFLFEAEGQVPTTHGRKIKALQKLIKHLVDAKFAIYGLDKTNENPEKKIVALTKNADNYYLVKSVSHGLEDGDLVRIRGVKGINVANAKGVHSVFDKTADTFVIHVSPDAAPDVVYQGKGLLRKQTRVLQEITGGEWVADRSRQTGRGNFSRVQGARRRAR